MIGVTGTAVVASGGVRAPAIDGLCGAGHPADEISQLDARSAILRRAAIEQLLGSPEPVHATLRMAGEWFLTSPAATALPLLADPWAQASLFRRTPCIHNVDDPSFEPGTAESLCWLGGAWADGLLPGADGFTVLPGADSGSYVYLPLSRIIVPTAGPAAVYREAGKIRLVMPARGSVTLSGETRSLRAGLHASGHVEVLPEADGRPLLNAVPLFGRISRVNRAGRDETRHGVPVIEEGLELLRRAWPAMRALVDRWVRGFVVISYEGCSRSHTSIYAPHVVMLSCESPLGVAEALCHETSHGRLFAFAAYHDLLVDDHAARHDSPWRSDRRPLISFLHGIHAFVVVCEFYRRLAESDSRCQSMAEQVIARQAPRVVAAWDYLQSHATWTPEGKRAASTLAPFVDGLRL